MWWVKSLNKLFSEVLKDVVEFVHTISKSREDSGKAPGEVIIGGT